MTTGWLQPFDDTVEFLPTPPGCNCPNYRASSMGPLFTEKNSAKIYCNMFKSPANSPNTPFLSWARKIKCKIVANIYNNFRLFIRTSIRL